MDKFIYIYGAAKWQWMGHLSNDPLISSEKDPLEELTIPGQYNAQRGLFCSIATTLELPPKQSPLDSIFLKNLSKVVMADLYHWYFSIA